MFVLSISLLFLQIMCMSPNMVGEQYVMWMTVLSSWLEQSSIRLIINADKTHLLVLGTNASADRMSMVSMVSMQANEYSFSPFNQEKLLGCIVSDKLK